MMQVVNYYEKGAFNEDVGRIAPARPEVQKILARYDDRVLEVNTEITLAKNMVVLVESRWVIGMDVRDNRVRNSYTTLGRLVCYGV